TDTETRHVIVHAVDAQLVCHVVKIGVVRTRDSQLEIYRAISAAVPVAVLVLDVGQLEVTGVEHPGFWRNHSGIQASNGHHRLDGRSRRVKTAQYAVEQRSVDRVTQFAVCLEADAGHEQVGIEARLADHRQHLTGGWLQRHDGSSPS